LTKKCFFAKLYVIEITLPYDDKDVVKENCLRESRLVEARYDNP